MFRCFKGKSDEEKGRRIMLTSTVLQAIVNQMTTGIFFTGFLAAYGFDIVNIGIVTLAPYISNLASVFTPALLHRFPKRKGILVGCKLIYYILAVAAFTLMPLVVTDTGMRMLTLSALLILANIFNGIATSGFSSWHVNFIPKEVRSDYFTAVQFLSNLIPGAMLLFSGMITDALSNSPAQLTLLTTLRWLAFAVALVDVFCLSRPKEYEYNAEATEKNADIFRIPLKNHRWLMVMGAVVLWNVSSLSISSALQVFLLEDVGVSYTYYNLIIILYSAAFPLFSGFWKKKIEQFSWLSVYGFTLLVYAICQLAYCFITPMNYLILMSAVRITQHVIGVGQNIAFANLQYICMPREHRTCYTSLYYFIFYLSALLGLGLGTLWCAVYENLTLSIFGFTLTTVPILMMASGFLILILAFYVWYLAKKLHL